VTASVTLLDDAVWNEERACVEVTARVHGHGGARELPMAVSGEALERLVRTPGRPDPLRLLRDFERDICSAAARQLERDPPELVVTARDLRAGA